VRLVAAALMVAGIFLIVADGGRMAISMLLATGFLCAIVSLVAERSEDEPTPEPEAAPAAVVRAWWRFWRE
jgi:hypothetical protein